MRRALLISAISRRPGLDFLLLATTAYFVLFYRLGDAPLYTWDEARIAHNSLEMLRSGHLLITTYHGEPDLWNTKPPGAVWLLSASMWLFGTSEWSLRLPSALAGLATVCLVYLYLWRITTSRAAALLAALVLLATPGYVGVHVTRTADYDSLLVLFVVGAAMAFFFCLERAENSGRVASGWFYLFALATCAAVFTKGIAGFLLHPGLAAYSIRRWRWMVLLRSPAAWASAASIVLVVVSFYGLREIAQPGYIAAVRANELGGRFAGTIEGQSGPWHYYLSLLIEPWLADLTWPVWGVEYATSAFPWSWLFPFTAAAALSAPQPAVRRAALWAVGCIVTYLAIISVAATKLLWYPAPLHPFLAIVTSLGAFRVWQALRRSNHRLMRAIGQTLPVMTIVMGCFLAIAVAYKNVRLAEAAPRLPEQDTEVFLKSVLANYPGLRQIRVVHNGHDVVPIIRNGRIEGLGPYHGPEEFYLRAFQFAPSDGRVVSSDYLPRPGETVIWCDKSSKFTIPPSGERIMRADRCSAVRLPDSAK